MVKRQEGKDLTGKEGLLTKQPPAPSCSDPRPDATADPADTTPHAPPSPYSGQLSSCRDHASVVLGNIQAVSAWRRIYFRGCLFENNRGTVQ